MKAGLGGEETEGKRTQSNEEEEELQREELMLGGREKGWPSLLKNGNIILDFFPVFVGGTQRIGREEKAKERMVPV